MGDCDLNVIGRKGFTLLELMIVVVIIGVLSVVAVTSYRRYTYGARNAEAQQFLQAIRLAQMSYFEQYGQFCGNPGGSAWPENVPTGATGAKQWGPLPNASPFFHLGVKSPGAVWFQYKVAAGGAGDNGGGAIKNLDRPWFWAQAHSDFNGNGQLSTFEVTSEKPETRTESINE
jgi:prepilin-type N-terminal cleavage/methylation domain-containing protein